MRYFFSPLFIFSVLLLTISGCNSTSQQSKVATTVKTALPEFNADSAYAYTAAQVALGPRVPNTAAHVQCADYLVNKLRSFGAEVMVQEADLKAFDNTVLHARNIIGRFQPEKNNRILLFAHWDSRPFADHDPDPSRRNQPIDGASDGASGVGVLLEIARHLGQVSTTTGVDIIFFDAEDYGTPDHLDVPYVEDSWCLGSQYWGKNPHVKNYSAQYGILLDMVGAKDATFYLEMFSMQVAPQLTKRIWNTAATLGYGSQFVFANGGMITDDHVYVHKYTGIPCVDIIQHDPSSNTSFGNYWHTHQDTMDNISTSTLKAVGQTVIAVIYEQ
jgi:Zn-dependent M28 family amino/carboxypeptidase